MTALNRTSTLVKSEKQSENGPVNEQQQVAPVVARDVATTDAVRQTWAVTAGTSSPLISRERTENGDLMWNQEVTQIVENDLVEADTLRPNGKVSTKTKKQVPPTKRRERETQMKSLHIDDDEDDKDVVEDQKTSTAENSSESQASGAEMFALSRPHARHHDLTTKHHRAADEAPFDRQVLVSIRLLLLISMQLLCLS